MKKEEFLKLLLARLIERGVPRDTAEKETEHVRVYLAESGMEELDISLDEMADGIINMLDDGSSNADTNQDITIPIAQAADTDEESVSDELEAAIAAMDAESESSVRDEASLGEKTAEPTILSDIPIFIEPEAEQATFETEPTHKELGTIASDDDTDADQAPVEVAADMPQETPAAPAADESTSPARITEASGELTENAEAAVSSDPSQVVSLQEEDCADIEEFIPYNKKEKMKKKQEKKSGNEWLYVAILVAAIPIAMALILVAFVLYSGFWATLAFVMIACLAILIVFVTAGTFVSIIGIVYGVVQLITGQIPVGLFEVGLGVIVGAAVMFLGILVYNFAVRFIPFGMKLLAKLFRSGFRGIKSGYEYLKGAVESI